MALVGLHWWPVLDLPSEEVHDTTGTVNGDYTYPSKTLTHLDFNGSSNVWFE